MERKRVGIVGGGQLGRMVVQAGLDLAVGIEVLDASKDAPCASIASRYVVGSPTNSDDVFNFGKDLSVVTIEMENVSVDGLRRLEESGVVVIPKPEHIAMIQDKGLQKQFFRERDVPTASFVVSETPAALGFPVVQKVRVGGYDGKGVKILKTNEEGCFEGSCVLEELVDVKAELSVLVARSRSEAKTYPCCEQAFNDENVATFIVSPPTSVDEDVRNEARAVAVDLADKMNFLGLLAVELFVTRDNKVLVNEIAPRPHNSGHHTIEASYTSQFSQLLRIVLDLPLGDTNQRSPYAATINLLGTESGSPPVYHGLTDALRMTGVYPHIYAKTKVSPGRKMGHVTILAQHEKTLHDNISLLDQTLKVLAS